MAIFKNKFFSKEGQKERLTNVVNVLKASITGSDKVVANVSNPVVKKTVETVANKPFTTAAAVAVVANPVAAAGTAKAVATSIGSSISNASLGTKVGLAVATPIATSAVINSPKLQKEIVNAPSSLSNIGKNIGKAVEDPTANNFKNIVKENPAITGVVIGGTALAVGTGASGVIATALNTQAVKENTALSKELALNTDNLKDQIIKEEPQFIPSNSSLLPKTIEGTKDTSLIPLTPSTQVVGKSVSSISKKRKKIIKKKSNPSNNVRVNVYNQTKSLYSCYHKRC